VYEGADVVSTILPKDNSCLEKSVCGVLVRMRVASTHLAVLDFVPPGYALVNFSLYYKNQ